MPLKLLSIYRDFNSRLWRNAADDHMDLSSASTLNKLSGTLGTERIVHVTDASLVHSERKKDNTKAWLEEDAEKAAGKTLVARDNFSIFTSSLVTTIGRDNYTSWSLRNNFNSASLKLSERDEQSLRNTFLNSWKGKWTKKMSCSFLSLSLSLCFELHS